MNLINVNLCIILEQSLRITPEIFLPRNINRYPIGNDGMKIFVLLIHESKARLVRITAKCKRSQCRNKGLRDRPSRQQSPLKQVASLCSETSHLVCHVRVREHLWFVGAFLIWQKFRSKKENGWICHFPPKKQPFYVIPKSVNANDEIASDLVN